MSDQPLAELRSLDGLSLVRRLAAERSDPSPTAAVFGYRLTAAAPGSATLTPRADHLTATGIVHGGVTATLCDTACGYAVQTRLPPGAYPVTRELRLRYRRPVRLDGGPLRCVATAPTLEGGLSPGAATRARATAVVYGPDGTRLAGPRRPSPSWPAPYRDRRRETCDRGDDIDPRRNP
ncbi:hypothetical protein GCM10009678_14310 [Actinomadura kijaniata]|uniref:Uncharacterized protein (TIGR00369 family) n=1 Tax=Actinomadura namibiensis TaxID=182080 RepID=A0A7W3QMI0_ACTNM|nr:PaaI family thioesterase [Actinomadura namibiensis]MBA8952602.1 uncharacterized protein (TIGR00369 family) [Actinomadura namibiensis]